MSTPKHSTAEKNSNEGSRTRPISKAERKKQLEQRQALQALISAGHEASKVGVLGQRMPEEQLPEGNESLLEEMPQIKEHPFLKNLPAGDDATLAQWIRNNSLAKSMAEENPELLTEALRLRLGIAPKKVYTPTPELVRS